MGSVFSKLWNDINQYYQTIQNDENKSELDDETSSDERSLVCERSLIGETCTRLDDHPHQNDTTIDSDLSESPSQTPIHKTEALAQKLNSMKLSFEDPRSPTSGIDRTPIELMLKYETLGDKLDAMRLSFGNASNITEETDDQSHIEYN